MLDVGCGTGDVSMLAADMVGPGGAVIAIDYSREALALARERAHAAGHHNIEFLEGKAEAFNTRDSFDFAVGRYVLVHQSDPAAFIGAVARNVRPGGVIAFHEVGVYDTRNPTTPPIPLWSKVYAWIVAAFQSVMPHPDVGARMVEHFHEAGLAKRTPTLFCGISTGGGLQSPLYGWTVHTLRSLIPQLEKIGAATADEIGIDILARNSLARCHHGLHAQLMSFTQFCGWARL